MVLCWRPERAYRAQFLRNAKLPPTKQPCHHKPPATTCFFNIIDQIDLVLCRVLVRTWRQRCGSSQKLQRACVDRGPSEQSKAQSRTKIESGCTATAPKHGVFQKSKTIRTAGNEIRTPLPRSETEQHAFGSSFSLSTNSAPSIFTILTFFTPSLRFCSSTVSICLPTLSIYEHHFFSGFSPHLCRSIYLSLTR